MWQVVRVTKIETAAGRRTHRSRPRLQRPWTSGCVPGSDSYGLRHRADWDRLPRTEVGGCSGAAVDAEGLEDVLEVAAHGSLGQPQPVGDLLVREAGGDEAKDLDLACGERQGASAGATGDVVFGPDAAGSR